MSKLHPELEKELKRIKDEYVKVTEFAKKLPMFESVIIGDKLQGDSYCQLANNYNGVYFAWGINWYTNTPINFEYDTGHNYYRPSVSVYINCISMFGDKLYDDAVVSLKQLVKKIKCYYYDYSDSTFYFQPDEVEDGLNALTNWYKEFKEASNKILIEQRRKELQAELDRISK